MHAPRLAPTAALMSMLALTAQAAGSLACPQLLLLLPASLLPVSLLPSLLLLPLLLPLLPPLIQLVSSAWLKRSISRSVTSQRLATAAGQPAAGPAGRGEREGREIVGGQYVGTPACGSVVVGLP